jgi:peptidyl-prolyl cis-trans isomerase C
MRTAVVHGVEIPESLIAEEAQNHPSLSAGEARTAAGHALATKALLLRRAAELGLVADPELDEDGREETSEAALVRQVLEAEVEIATPTDAEIRRVFDAQRHRFRSPLLYEASHILIAPAADGEVALEQARLIAESVAADLSARPETFEQIARETSDCPSAEVGGSLGQLKPGDLVAEVEAALLRLQPGEIARDPVRSRFGWHVLRLARRIDGRELPFEVAAERIRLHLESRAWIAAASRYVQVLADEARSRGVVVAMSAEGTVAPGQITLGGLLGDGEAADRLQPWLEVADPALAARVSEAATRSQLDAATFVRRAAVQFVDGADDEAWTQLISAARDADDPTLAALSAILKSRLEPPKRNFTVIRRRNGG